MTLAWGPILDAAARGDLPGVSVGQSAALIGRAFGGRQPVYLATPYSRECLDVLGAWSHEESSRMARRAEAAAAQLRSVGVSTFSPVSQAVAMINATGTYRHHRSGAAFVATIDPLDGAAWSAWCQPFLNVCGAVVVPDIPGWDQSDGIWAEVQFAILRSIPVFVYAGAE